MIQYARIGLQIYETVSCGGPFPYLMSQDWQTTYAHFQRRLGNWRELISDKFQFTSVSERAKQWNRQLSQTLHLRANNLEMVVARLVILGKGIPDHALTEIWSTCLNAVTDTTCALVNMNCLPTTSQIPPAEFDYFLISSWSISLLALSRRSQYSLSQPVELSSAQQSAELCFSLLKSRAGLSRQSGTMWKRANDLTSRLKSVGVLPNGAPSEASEATDTMRSLNAYGIQETLTKPWEDQPLVDSPLEELRAGFFSYEDDTEGIALAKSIFHDWV